MGGGNGKIAAFLDEWAQAERDGDTAVLDGRLVEDFVGVGPLGFLLSRQDWLDRYARGLQYDEFSLDETQVRVYGDTAVVIGRQNQRGNHQGNPIPEAARATLVLLNQSGGWRLASIHLSFVAGTPGAPPMPGRREGEDRCRPPAVSSRRRPTRSRSGSACAARTATPGSRSSR